MRIADADPLTGRHAEDLHTFEPGVQAGWRQYSLTKITVAIRGPLPICPLWSPPTDPIDVTEFTEEEIVAAVAVAHALEGGV